MTRWGLAFTVLVALALVAMVASAFYDSSTVETGGAYAAQVGTIGADWVHIEWYQDSAGGLHYAVVSATPSPEATAPATNTPRPSVTPTPTATSTTRPTDTPLATNAPVYTSTPTLAPTAPTMPAVTPTPELTPIPTAEPSTPVPHTELCWGTVVADTLRIRTGAGTAADTIGGLKAGAVVRVLGVQYVGDDEWAHIISADAIEGWAAAWYGGQTFIEYEPSAECLAVRFGEGDTYRTGPAALLWHYVPGGNIMELIVAGQIAASNGRKWGALVVDDVNVCIQVEAAGGVCIARSNAAGDCPRLDLPPDESAADYLARNVWYATVSSASLYAITNECDISAAAWWNQFIIAAVKQAKVLNFPPLVVGNFLAHEPSEAWVQATAPAWAAVRTYSGMMGLHSYSYFDDTWLCAPSQWMPTDRDLLVRGWLEAAGVPGVQFVYSEIAPGRGDRPVSAQTISDIACWLHKADERRAVSGGALWTSGRVGEMPADATLDGHMIEIARAVG